MNKFYEIDGIKFHTQISVANSNFTLLFILDNNKYSNYFRNYKSYFADKLKSNLKQSHLFNRINISNTRTIEFKVDRIHQLISNSIFK